MRLKFLGMGLMAIVLPLSLPHREESQELPEPQTVVVSSGSLKLRGLLWQPSGRGTFPAVLFNHGSGHASGKDPAGNRDHRNPELLAPPFVKHGYVFLYLFRRGDGLSGGQGIPDGDLMDRALASGGRELRNAVQLKLLETDELADALAGLAFLRGMSGVDRARIAVVGHSFGASLSLLVAERDSSLRAVVAFATGGYSWDNSPELRERLLTAADRTSVPIFFLTAANDFSIAPTQRLAQEMERLGKRHRSKVYPAVGSTAQEGHDFIHLRIPEWEPDVFNFLTDQMSN